jgi:putative phage-type endonuclease
MALLHSEWLDLRRRHIGSSEVASLFGLDERRTLFELWHQKAGNLPEPEMEDERVFWGTVLGPAIGQGIAEREGWTIRKVRRYIEHPHVAGMGASLDYEIFGNPRGAGTLEIKNVDRLVARDWPDGLPPFRFELQVQHQLACLPNRAWATLGVLIGGNSLKIFEYERHPGAIARIERAVEAFWKSIAENRPPEPDFDRDLPTLEALYGSAAPGSVRDLRGHRRLERLCADYERAREDETAAERRKRTAKGAILSIIEDTETVFCEGFKILAPERSGGDVSYQRKPYRDFRIYARSAGEEDQVS